MRRLLSLFLVAVTFSFTGCTSPDADEPQGTAGSMSPTLAFEEIDTPTASGSSLPNFSLTPGGEVLLSWVEQREGKTMALRFAQHDGNTWTPPQTIAEGDDWFVNWADFPSVVALSEQALAAHLLVKSGPGTYAYDVQITQSRDGGQTWGPATKPHNDGTQTEHGFVSMLPTPEGRLRAVWLDGRHTGGGHGGHGGGAMTLRTATLGHDGTLAEEAELDNRICDCCQTSAAATANGVIVAYRDRSDEEIRDIAVIRLDQEGWSEPRTVHDDGWEIAGCPVNGPAVAADSARVAVAWFTAAGDTPRVRVAFSSDEGATFGPPMTVDGGHPIGRVDVAMLPDGSALVTWVEKTETRAAIQARRLHPDGTSTPPVVVAPTSPQRASGFPQLIRQGTTLYVAWTDAGDPHQVRTAIARL